ncbi:MAG: VTC domain-containing protein [Acidimicrobiales bacterium]
MTLLDRPVGGPRDAPMADVADRAGVGLDELDAAASLRTRYDHKFVMSGPDLTDLLGSLGPEWVVLDVDGSRSTRYVTTYFDSPGLHCYRQHLQGRRRRFKVRTRRYGPEGDLVLEAKLKGVGGRTVKHRWPHDGALDALDVAAVRRIDDVLRRSYGVVTPPQLVPTVSTEFDRITLAHLDAHERITVDLSLRVIGDESTVEFAPDVAIVETKSTDIRGLGFAAVLAGGTRPSSMSKYCVGVTALRGDVRGNPWLPALRQLRARG